MGSENSAKISPSPSSLEYLKSIYFDSTQSIRHYDNVRSSFTHIFSAILAIFSSFVTYSLIHGFSSRVIFSSLCAICSFSVISIIIVVRLNKLIDIQRRRASLAMRAYQECVKDFDFFSINYDAKSHFKNQFLASWRLGYLWILIFIVIIIYNILLLILFL